MLISIIRFVGSLFARAAVALLSLAGRLLLRLAIWGAELLWSELPTRAMILAEIGKVFAGLVSEAEDLIAEAELKLFEKYHPQA